MVLLAEARLKVGGTCGDREKRQLIFPQFRLMIPLHVISFLSATLRLDGYETVHSGSGSSASSVVC